MSQGQKPVQFCSPRRQSAKNRAEFRKAHRKALCPQLALLLFLLGSSGDGNVPANYKGKHFQGSATSLARLMPTVVPASSFVVSSLSAKGASGPRKGQKST